MKIYLQEGGGNMVFQLTSLALQGITPFPVEVEVALYRGLPVFDIVGLPDTAVKEARERVRSALYTMGLEIPKGRVLINLAPAGIRKVGSCYDLPILLGILGLTEPVTIDLAHTVFLGELSLSGDIRRVNGVLPMLLGARKLGVTQAFIPFENAAEASVVQDMRIYALRHANELLAYIRDGREPPLAQVIPSEGIPEPPPLDFADVRGQYAAKRALEIAAAGSHNILLIGPPGTGKSMLAKRMPSILPDLSKEEALEVTQVYSAAGRLPSGVPLMKQRPFRAPHHSTSSAGLCGGGAIPTPGEITLAHNGILFLDELPEFQRNVVEAIRQPMEDGTVTIARAATSLTFPSNFTLVCAMNPCPCGFYGHPVKKCTCPPQKVQGYLGKISGPLLDRLDLHVEVLPVSYEVMSGTAKEESSAQVRDRVMAARAIQEKRFAGTDIACNAHMTPSLLREFCPLTEDASALLSKVFDKMSLSGRAYDRILKVARTVADMEHSQAIGVAHLSEALQYRSLDRKYWSERS